MATVNEIIFNPPLSRISSQLSRSGYAAICGPNNSGKSLVLKNLKKVMGLTAYMVGPQRFYHIYHIGTQLRQQQEFEMFDNQFNSQFNDAQYNHETNYIDLGRILANMSNVRRESLFEVCGRLIGSKFSLQRVEEDNDLSMRYVDMDGQNISVGSTGTRLLMTLIGLCMDERIGTILIDEPELGLSPKVQFALANFFAERKEREKYFPSLNSIIVSTHSHIFLDRKDIQNNFVVSKNNNQINVHQISSFNELHNLQFNLLGNSLESMFLPSAFVLVEGKTDEPYIEKCINTRFPDKRVIVVEAQGDIKQRLHALRISLGEIHKSPFQSRIFAVLDSVHTKSDPAALEAMGMIKENIIIWEKNGIEYYYPSEILSEYFGCSIEKLPGLSIKDDNVSMNGVNVRKTQLSEIVLSKMGESTVLPKELEQKLLEPLGKAIQ